MEETTLAKLVRDYRISHNLSLKKFGLLMECTGSYVSDIESGRRKPLIKKTLTFLSYVLGCDIEYLTKIVSDERLKVLGLSKKEDGWISCKDKEPPKDKAKIIRWHKIYKCSVSVYYCKFNAPKSHPECVWTDSIYSNTWPEDAFLPYWKHELDAPGD